MASRKLTIATLGSHSALQILKGAKEEGFKTLLVTTNDRADFYKRFKFIDKIQKIKSFSEFPEIDKKLAKENTIIIPHGSFVAYLGVEGNKKIKTPYFGNKKVLEWEGNRRMQLTWIKEANLNLPHKFRRGDVIDRPVIVKFFGAQGGNGYFVAHDQKDFKKKIVPFLDREFVVQEYVIGVPIYLHFFYSPITKDVELLSIDRRYETNVDSLGRMPLAHQEKISIAPSFVVVGNSPLSLRESLMPEAYQMAERLVATSRKLVDKRGLFGPFCLETIVTPDQKFFIIEISCRIVAGTNLFIDGSPYASLYYDEPMSTGRRIAREIKIAKRKNKLNLILD
ncbi:MAG TPA: formate--phosphoribosylaminoimidazolecarboxamide ligase [Patescibacteria group bacterium]